MNLARHPAVVFCYYVKFLYFLVFHLLIYYLIFIIDLEFLLGYHLIALLPNGSEKTEEWVKNDQSFFSITVSEDYLIITHFRGQLSVKRRSLLSHFLVINRGSHRKMMIDENYTSTKGFFFEISHFSVM